MKKGVDHPLNICQIACAYGTIPSKMRTKTLIITAFVGALGIAGASAQVYSVNAVGYVNKSIPKGFSIVSNPLSNGENKVSEIFGANPGELTIYRFDGAQFSINPYIGFLSAWEKPDEVIAPGEGFFVYNPGDATNITFVGEVPQGDLSNQLPKGFSLRSSQVPQEGGLSSDLGFPVDTDVSVYQFSNGTYSLSSYIGFLQSWDPAEPNVSVAEGFWVLREASEGNWTRSFSTSE